MDGRRKRTVKKPNPNLNSKHKEVITRVVKRKSTVYKNPIGIVFTNGLFWPKFDKLGVRMHKELRGGFTSKLLCQDSIRRFEKEHEVTYVE